MRVVTGSLKSMGVMGGRVNEDRKPIIPLGTKTQWGKIEAIGILSGERYYWMANGCSVAMIPAFIVEAEHEKTDNSKD